MTSILTNTAAMNSLQALSITQRNLARTQDQISSGLRVANASDNAAYWSISTSMKARISTLDAINRGLSLTQSILTVADKGTDLIRASLVKIHDDLVEAQQSGLDLKSVQSDISAQQQVILNVAQSSSLNGVNLVEDTVLFSGTMTADQNEYGSLPVPLPDTASPPSTTHSYTLAPTGIGSDGSISTTKIYNSDIVQVQYYSDNLSNSNYSTADRYYANDDVGVVGLLENENNTGIGGVLELDITTLTKAGIATVANQVQGFVDRTTSTQAIMSSTMTQVGNQMTFNSSLSDALTSGVGSLVDADMNVASTRLQALQTQQQLGIQALSIANQDSQLTLKLFGQA